MQSEPEIELSCFDEPLKIAREVVALRGRLENARREHAALLAQREDALSEGIDLLLELRVKHFEMQKLTSEIAQLEQRIHWLVDQGVTKLDAENNQIAGQQYIKNRDTLRKLVEPFRGGLASVLRGVEASVDLGPSLTNVHNIKLACRQNDLDGSPQKSPQDFRTPRSEHSARLWRVALLILQRGRTCVRPLCFTMYLQVTTS